MSDWSSSSTPSAPARCRAASTPSSSTVITERRGWGHAPPTSSHGAGVAEAWALGTVLGRTPDRLVVLGVEGTCFEPGYGLTGAVARAVPGVARAVHEEIRAQARDSSDVSQ